jgi:hypothetical protein
MPNHCSNQLTLDSGEDILQVLSPYLTLQDDQDEEYTFDFNKIIPEPKPELEDWYGWRLANWGTKWEGYEGMVNQDQTAFSFITAWSPPIPIIRKLAELTGQKFVLTYIEEGMFFCGKYTAGIEAPGGDVEEYDEYYASIKDAPKELLDELGYEEYEE